MNSLIDPAAIASQQFKQRPKARGMDAFVPADPRDVVDDDGVADRQQARSQVDQLL